VLYFADRLHSQDPMEVQGLVSTLLAEVVDEYRRQPDSPYGVALSTHPRLVGAAISLGELHQAAADHLNPDRDDAIPEIDRLASAATLVGRCVYLSVRLLRLGHTRGRETGDTCSASTPPARLQHLTTALIRRLEEAASAVAESLPHGLLPPRLQARVPEGYAFYCVYPEMYLASLAKLLRQQERRTAYTVVGIRSIGTSLAAFVAGALQEKGLQARVETLRPRGHPFDRRIRLAPTLQNRLVGDARAGSAFLIVDEGPGLTCSSFLSVCSAISTLGVAEKQLAILSAWRGAPSIYASEESRALWKRLPVFHTDAVDAFDGWRALLPFLRGAVSTDLRTPRASCGTTTFRIHDISYGCWRKRLYTSPEKWPVVHRAGERVKLLVDYVFSPLPKGEGQGGDSPSPPPFPGAGPAEGQSSRGSFFAKFAGLGEYGQQKLERARILAEAGFSPPVAGLAYGFLVYRFVVGASPMAAPDLSDAMTARMVEYYAFIARHFSVPASPRFEQLAEVISVNAREALGVDPSPFLARWERWRETIDTLPLTLLDGRPQPHEWLRVASSNGVIFLKTDSVDHCSDHTLVGEQSILWDLAGACEEWGMDQERRACMLRLWERATGDRDAANLIDFYRAAYLAFRTAALHYAVHGTEEEPIRTSLQQEEWTYRHRLRELIESCQSSALSFRPSARKISLSDSNRHNTSRTTAREQSDRENASV